MSARGRIPAIILTVAIVITLGGAGFLLVSSLRSNTVEQIVSRGEEIRTLWILEGPEGDIAYTASIINPATGRLALIDVPADLGRILRTLDRVDRIDAVLSERGVEAFAEEVGDVLGVPMDHYVRLGPEFLADLVDIAGGLPVAVLDAIEILDTDIPLLVPGGQAVLAGSELVPYLEGRDEDTDELLDRRWNVLVSLLQQMQGAEAILATREARRALSRELDSSLEWDAFRELSSVVTVSEPDSVLTQRILGQYRSVDTASGPAVLLFPLFEGNLARDVVRQTREALANEAAPTQSGPRIRLEVLNGTTVSGLARRTADLMQSFGFRVVNIGNAQQQDQQQTVVIDRRGDRSAAERAAAAINAQRIEVQAGEFVPGPEDPEVTLILGEDFDGRTVRTDN